MAQRMTFGLFSGAASQRIEFVRMKGPRGTIGNVSALDEQISLSLPLSPCFVSSATPFFLFREGARGDGCDEAEGFGGGDADLGARLLRHGFPVGRRLGRRRGTVSVSTSTKAIRPEREPEQFRAWRVEDEAGYGRDQGKVGERRSGLDGERVERNRSRRRS